MLKKRTRKMKFAENLGKRREQVFSGGVDQGDPDFGCPGLLRSSERIRSLGGLFDNHERRAATSPAEATGGDIAVVD